MKKIGKGSAFGFTLTVVVCFCVWAASPAWAGTQIKPIEGVSYNVDASMADNLKSLVGKRVIVTIGSGATLAGYVKKVGNHFLHLEKITRKEFFDALIRIDSITAIETKFRDYTRG
jgi:small nuclear ribonucleoprotein (snRNP)-like protein